MRCMVGVCLVLWVLVSASPGLGQELPEPSPPPARAVSWEAHEWWTVWGSSLAGAVVVPVGSVGVYWKLSEACRPGQSVQACLLSHFPSSLILTGATIPLGATLGTVLAGDALGCRGDWALTLGGSVLGLMGFALPLTCYTCGWQVSGYHTPLLIGAGLSMLMSSGTALVYYHITQPKPAMIGASRGARPTWELSAPLPLPLPDGQGRWWFPVAQGRF